MKIVIKVSLVIYFLFGITSCGKSFPNSNLEFDGRRALDNVAAQLSFGPRIPGSEGHELTRQWIVQELATYGWNVEIQIGDFKEQKLYNIYATREREGAGKNSKTPWVILGAHYDTRPISDKDDDPELRMSPVPGANDGASGVAVLLELARVMPKYQNLDVSLVIFDMEDGGGLPGGEWIVGSNLFAERLATIPDAVVIIDMIGDGDQQIYYERTSDYGLRSEIWDIARNIGVGTFITEEKYSILDDHSPFLARGITAIDIIDFDYPYWHTSEDTLEKVSAQSLHNVGQVLLAWLDWKANQVP
jgi:Zn-dependent M28 family amino/carboxypeptidase